MKYFDRKLFVVQHILIKHLPAGYDYDKGNQISASGKQGGLQFFQKGELKELFEVLEIIVSDSYDMKSFLPERILKILNDDGVRNKEQHLLLDWIKECGQRFSENIECWKSSVNEYIPYLSWNKYDCFKTADPNIFPAKVSIYLYDIGTMLIIPDNNPWGEMVFQFPESQVTGLESSKYEGWLMWAEIERLDECYEFSFLFNTDSKEVLSIESIMRDNNWIEFKVRCKQPTMKVKSYDYSYRWYEAGCQSTKIYLESCRALLTKAKDLGALYLNEKERVVLYLAQLYDCFSSAVNPEITDINPVDTLKLEEFVKNQYGFKQTVSIISDIGDIELLEALNNLKKIIDIKGIRKESSEYKRLVNIMEDRDKSSLGRLLYKNLSQLMMDASSEYVKEWSGYGNFLKIRNAVIKEIEPSIIKMGFAGEFPHYRRISKNIGEYITVFSVNHGYSNLSGVDVNKSGCVRMSILTGRAPLTVHASDYFLSGLPFEKSNAWDCTWEKQKCRSVCIGPSDDEGWFEFCCEGISFESDIQEKAAGMLPYLDVVNCTLGNKPVPDFYLKHHREHLKRNKTVKKLMGIIVLGGFLFGFIMWILSSVILPFIFKGGVKKVFDIWSFLIALGCGAIFGIIMGIYILYDIRRKVWPS